VSNIELGAQFLSPFGGKYHWAFCGFDKTIIVLLKTNLDAIDCLP
jgi:hypothetical protein